MATEDTQSWATQIEGTADHYEPAVYEALTFYSSLELQQDELAQNFIPLTGANSRHSSDTKLFAIGLLPPSATVSQDLLDRSASVQTVTGEFQQGLNAATPKGKGVKPVRGDGNATTQFQKRGRKNAGQALRTIAQTSNKDLNQTGLGREYLAAQRNLIVAMQTAIDRIAATPPLRMLVNPQSFRVSSERIFSDGNWGRNGPIVEHWGNGQDKIQASGKLAAFYALEKGTSDKGASQGPGLTRTARQFSKSYQNFLSLWLLYKNNGGIYLTDSLGDQSRLERRHLALLGSVYMYYDGTLYVGSFDSLSLTETDTAPFTLEYNLAFTVRASFLLDRPSDPRFSTPFPVSLGAGQTSPLVPRADLKPSMSQVIAGNERFISDIEGY